MVVIILAFTNVHTIKEPLQNFSYALKLQLEFFVLNQLLEVSGDGFAPGGRPNRQSRYHAPTTSDASKGAVLEKSGDASLGSAQRLPSNETSASSVGKEAAVGAVKSSPLTDHTVIPPAAARVRGPSLTSPISPPAPTSVPRSEDLYIPRPSNSSFVGALGPEPGERHATKHSGFVAPLRVSSRNAPAAERALPSPPPLLEEPPMQSWLDLEGRLTDVERRLNSMV